MKDYMDPFEYIEEENIDEKLEIALENPYSVISGLMSPI